MFLTGLVYLVFLCYYSLQKTVLTAFLLSSLLFGYSTYLQIYLHLLITFWVCYWDIILVRNTVAIELLSALCYIPVHVVTVWVSIIPLHSDTLNALSRLLNGLVVGKDLEILQQVKHREKPSFTNTVYWPQHILTHFIHHCHHNHITS